jgi:hypothetical protein
MRAWLLFLTLVVVAGEYWSARERSRPLAPPFWSTANDRSHRVMQCQDPVTGRWLGLDRRDGTVLARGDVRAETFVEACDNLGRRDRGEQLRYDFIR